MPRGRATVRDIAAATGVSIATVSRVLNQQGNVAPETRRAGRAGGRGARTARARTARRYAEAGRRGGLRALPVRADRLLRPDRLVDRRDAGPARPAARPQRRRGRRSTTRRSPSLAGSAAAIGRRDPDPSARAAATSWSGSRSRRFPFVVVDPRTPLPRDIAAVSAAHFAGARQLTAHLTGLGHTRIGVIAGPREWLASDARLSGHAAALADVGILPDPSLVRHVEPTTEQGYRAAGRAARPRPARRPRWSPSTTRPRSARCRPPPSAVSRSPPTCRSPASTTSTSAAPPRPSSPPSASPCRRWAGWPSAC